MTPPSLRRLAAEAFDGAPAWFLETLLPLFNNFLSDLNANLARGLTADDNLAAAFLEDYELTTGADPLTSLPFTFAFPDGLKSWTPRDVRVTKVSTPASDTTIAALIQVAHWDVVSRNGKSAIRIRSMPGLQASTTYRLTFRLE